jgi:hypothetical protein
MAAQHRIFAVLGFFVSGRMRCGQIRTYEERYDVMNALKPLLFGTFALLATSAIAQDFLKADHKMLGHRVQSSQQHAQDHAQTLYHAPQPIPKDESKELVAAMKKELTTADRALNTLKAEVAKNKEAVELIESIKKHHAKAHEHCDMAEEACMKEAPEKGEVGNCCADMYHEMEAAKAETAKLLKMLKIEKLEPPKKPAAKK